MFNDGNKSLKCFIRARMRYQVLQCLHVLLNLREYSGKFRKRLVECSRYRKRFFVFLLLVCKPDAQSPQFLVDGQRPLFIQTFGFV